MPRAGLPFDRHQQLGRDLADLGKRLDDLRGELDRAYPTAQVLPSRMKELTRALQLLREELEERLWADHPTQASESVYLPRRRR